MRGLGCRRGALGDRPGRRAAAALTLAVGIGATTDAFDAVLLHDLDRQEGLDVRCARSATSPPLRPAQTLRL